MQAVLRNEFFTLTVDTLGAEAVSLKNAAGEKVLWQADPEVWPRHAPILFPWTGELPQSSYSHQGKTYHVVKQGFARDVEHTLVRADEHEIVMELRSSPELKETWFPYVPAGGQDHPPYPDRGKPWAGGTAFWHRFPPGIQYPI